MGNLPVTIVLFKMLGLGVNKFFFFVDFSYDLIQLKT
jgi:hypothetical protein